MSPFERHAAGGPLSGLRMPRSRSGPIVAAVGVAALIVVVAAVVAAVQGGGRNAASPPVAAPASSRTPAPASGSERQRAATELAALLPASGGDRGDVNRAYSAVETCQALPADQAVFEKAAANRRNLLTRLGALPGVSALDPAMIQALTGAWTASAQADADYASWAAALARGCHKDKTLRDPNLRASYGPDAAASADKEKFAGLWNPFAAGYGLPSYSPGQL